MRQTLKRWGNSPAVRIPAEVMKTVQLRLDDDVEISVDNKGRIMIEPVEKALTLAALLEQVTPENLHGEVEVGEVRRVGNGIRTG